jgi:hypothetical protein
MGTKRTDKCEILNRPAIDLTRHTGYANAVRRLDDLTQQLAVHTQEAKHLQLLTNRGGQAAQHYASQTPELPPGLDESELWAIAAKVAAAGGVGKEIVTSLRARRATPRSLEPGDLQDVLVRDDERSTCALLKMAIVLQNDELAKQKRSAVAQALESFKDERRIFVERLAVSLVQLSELLAEEKAYGKWLARADPALLNAMRPKLFPTEILAQVQIIEWFRDATDQGMLDTELTLVPVASEVVGA